MNQIHSSSNPPVPFDALLTLAGVEKDSPHTTRCLVVDPPAGLADILVSWVASALAENEVRPSLVADAITIRLSVIEKVRPEKERLAAALSEAGVDDADSVTIADNWVEFAPAGRTPDQAYQTALYFGREQSAGVDVASLLAGSFLRSLVYVGVTDWTTDLEGAFERRDLINHLTLQIAIPRSDSQLLKFEVSGRRPQRVVLHPTSRRVCDPWGELVWWEAERHHPPVPGEGTPRMGEWDIVPLPRPLGHDGAPWHLLGSHEGRVLNHLHGKHSQLSASDVRLGANGAIEPMWLVASVSDLASDETRPYLDVKNLRGADSHNDILSKMIWTRDEHNDVRPLEDMSYRMQEWVQHHARRFESSVRSAGIAEHQGRWWGSPWVDLPQKTFVALPAIESQGLPTVVLGGTVTAPGVLWFEPQDLSATACAALLTVGPVRDQISALSAHDETGQAVITPEVLASIRLPHTIHPLVQDDLELAYYNGDIAGMQQLAEDIFNGKQRIIVDFHRKAHKPLFA